MLDPLDSWKQRLLAMPDVGTNSEGAWNLANFCGDEMDKVNAIGGTVGIFTFDRPLFVSTLLAIVVPEGSLAWVDRFTTAWATACGSNTITPATVVNGAWSGSVKDVVTLPSGNATIVTLAAAKATLDSELTAQGTPFVNKTVTSKSQVVSLNGDFAQAVRDATLVFQFDCIGLNALMVPVHVVLAAQ
jgi:hypothetical protein